MTRKLPFLAQFIFLGFAVSLWTGATALAIQSTQVPLNPGTIPQFAQPLPILSVAGGTMATAFGNQSLTITMCEFDANILPLGTIAAGVQPTTESGDTLLVRHARQHHRTPTSAR